MLEIFLGVVSRWFSQLKPSIQLNYCFSVFPPNSLESASLHTNTKWENESKADGAAYLCAPALGAGAALGHPADLPVPENTCAFGL